MSNKFSYKKDTYVKEVTKSQARDLVSKHHYLKDKSFMFKKAYGLFSKETDELIGVAVYSNVTGISALKSWFGLDNKNTNIYELIRLVLVPEHNGKNAASFLLGRSLRMLKSENVRGVISLADSEQHNGYVYQATNFKYYGLTDKKTDFYRHDGKLNPRGETKTQRGVWLERSRKHRYFFQLDSTLSPVLEESPFPKELFTEVTCCQGTKRVYDSRFNEYWDCPKCK